MLLLRLRIMTRLCSGIPGISQLLFLALEDTAVQSIKHWRNAEAERTVKMLCARNGWDTDILILGNHTEIYRYSALIDDSGYALHQAWAETQGENPVAAQELYNKNEYNYWSTRASAIWQKHRRRLGIADVAPETAVAEHERWMAYMLSQGFVYGADKDLLDGKNASKHHRL